MSGQQNVALLAPEPVGTLVVVACARLVGGPEVHVAEISRDRVRVEATVYLKPRSRVGLNITIAQSTYTAYGRVTEADAVMVGGQLKYSVTVDLDAENPAFDGARPLDPVGGNAGEPKGKPLAALPAPTPRPGDVPSSESAVWMKECSVLQERLQQMEEQAVNAQIRAQQAEAQAQDLGARAAQADAAAAAAEREIDARAKDRRDWTAQKTRLMARLERTERACADQQLLLYVVQQQLESASTLINGWKPPAAERTQDEQ